MKFYGAVESSVVEPPFSGRDGGDEVDPKFFSPVSGGEFGAAGKRHNSRPGAGAR